MSRGSHVAANRRRAPAYRRVARLSAGRRRHVVPWRGARAEQDDAGSNAPNRAVRARGGVCLGIAGSSGDSDAMNATIVSPRQAIGFQRGQCLRATTAKLTAIAPVRVRAWGASMAQSRSNEARRRGAAALLPTVAAGSRRWWDEGFFRFPGDMASDLGKESVVAIERPGIR